MACCSSSGGAVSGTYSPLPSRCSSGPVIFFECRGSGRPVKGSRDPPAPRALFDLDIVAPYTAIVKGQLFSNRRAVATGPVSTGPLFGALSHVFVVNQRLMAARTSFKASLPNLPDTPHHLKDVAFPKRTFRKSKPVLCSAWSQWFSTCKSA